MKPTCICDEAITFGRRNSRRCPKCHSLQIRDHDGYWVYEYTEETSGLSESAVFIPRKRRSDYARTAAQTAFEAAQYQKARYGL